MSKRMLRSVLATAFSALIAFGALGVVGAQGGDEPNNDTVWSLPTESDGQDTIYTTDDTVWSMSTTSVGQDIAYTTDDTVWS